ncbi:TPA: GTP pyrophosphokinase [Vibrio parahaemolyticus]|uniref:GTP pyrophosphokinase n=1 Tax=Vibrio parahaemolyticus TaxID=670 RepID=UPI000A752B21|nr:hypothetical protein [Vibrio parahaemolyticus]
MTTQYIDMVWAKNPQYIRKFHENKQMYNLLCDEVKFILNKALSDACIETASITARTKTESSFCEKLNRKSYTDPFVEITDFAGARVVFLYSSDRSRLEELIEREFEIVEKVDKVEGSGVDQFGYGALHYLVHLKTDYLKARYPELENLTCEIQVRTILQDAWAVVAHHLSYKQESDIPHHLRRKLNALSGLFETADDQFERIRELRYSYQQAVSEDIEQNKDDGLGVEIEVDNLSAYLAWKFPDRRISDGSSISDAIHELKSFGYITLKQLDDILNRTEKAILAYESEHPPYNPQEHVPTRFAQIGMVRVALEFIENDFLHRLTDSAVENKMKFMHLVE